MTIAEFVTLKDQFLMHLEVERGLTENTVKSYKGDLGQFECFWSRLSDKEQEPNFKQLIERYLVNLYYKKINRASIARKLSCFKSFERFLESYGIMLKLEVKRPRLYQKLPEHLSIDEVTFLLDQVPDESLETRYPMRTRTILELFLCHRHSLF